MVYFTNVIREEEDDVGSLARNLYFINISQQMNLIYLKSKRRRM